MRIDLDVTRIRRVTLIVSMHHEWNAPTRDRPFVRSIFDSIARITVRLRCVLKTLMPDESLN